MNTIIELANAHQQCRRQAINLIVSENRLSDPVSELLSNDLASRYAAPFYAGTDISQEITRLTIEKTKSVFSAKFANISPTSGSNSLMAVIFALTEPGDKVARVPPFFPGGGYPFQYEVFHRHSLPLVFDDAQWQLDRAACIELLLKEQPKLVVLGASIFMVPMPVREISEIVHSYGGVVAYDGSHSLGLIAGGQYQNPLDEGADILFGSTHKTFPGPQGGIIVTNSESLHFKIELVSNFTPLNGPTMVCNPHLARIAALGLTLDEVPWQQYAKQVVENARCFARVFSSNGIVLRGERNSDFSHSTYCHQVLPLLDKDQGLQYRDKLKAHGIFCDGFMRVGTAEITRLGFTEQDSTEVAQLMCDIVQSDQPVIPEAKQKVNALVESHREIVM
ncbi:PLP-dependent transferase [Pseudoalteromonas sp. McH1-7]|uniref:Serine hydroxymethyltransferase-like domain-containing protein n=2 Tax=Pseudoalteromonas TaxID=53246 RepID=A0A8I0MVT2_9GAMM|nr:MULTISPECIES: PLP-dependent transferase [Pseudoalteromonas]MBE0346731.1 hypothetical protein [Pseudoalteromonas peptidolytica F12-50-A1]MDW7549909.1 PLP-dependent transferase [Pseudoalteromonas peptidolytica]NUZ09449.1 PLP-dependent transferase [Pseudoalteromonas sp. McH1-7]GEK09072.1 serine hydroxymethyltransferase [Pseudoalteromonas peptidolytica]